MDARDREHAARRPLPFRLVLIDRNPHMVAAWTETFADAARDGHIAIAHGDITDVRDSDAFVSPGNSFMFFDGGIDAVYSRLFPDLQRRARGALRSWPKHAARDVPYCPIGEAMIVPTGSGICPFMVCAPTMLQGGEDLAGTDNVERAFYAALSLCCRLALDPRTAALVRRVACPGMGTGVGRMPHVEAAAQMRRAFDRCAANVHAAYHPVRPDARLGEPRPYGKTNA